MPVLLLSRHDVLQFLSLERELLPIGSPDFLQNRLKTDLYRFITGVEWEVITAKTIVAKIIAAKSLVAKSLVVTDFVATGLLEAAPVDPVKSGGLPTLVQVLPILAPREIQSLFARLAAPNRRLLRRLLRCLLRCRRKHPPYAIR
jgi:hypothetical protein